MRPTKKPAKTHAVTKRDEKDISFGTPKSVVKIGNEIPMMIPNPIILNARSKKVFLLITDILLTSIYFRELLAKSNIFFENNYKFEKSHLIIFNLSVIFIQ